MINMQLMTHSSSRVLALQDVMPNGTFPKSLGFISLIRLVKKSHIKCLEKGKQSLKGDWANFLFNTFKPTKAKRENMLSTEKSFQCSIFVLLLLLKFRPFLLLQHLC